MTKIIITEWEKEIDKDTPADFGTTITVDGKDLKGDLNMNPDICIKELLNTLGVNEVEIEYKIEE